VTGADAASGPASSAVEVGACSFCRIRLQTLIELRQHRQV
jgi:hypothetical protein